MVLDGNYFSASALLAIPLAYSLAKVRLRASGKVFLSGVLGNHAPSCRRHSVSVASWAFCLYAFPVDSFEAPRGSRMLAFVYFRF